MSDQKYQKYKIGKEVFICVIHNQEVYNGHHSEASFSSCKKYLDEILSGKRKNFDLFVAKGKITKVTERSSQNDLLYEIIITKLYLKVKMDLSKEGKHGSYAGLWIQVGKYLQAQIKNIKNTNPSRRKSVFNF